MKRIVVLGSTGSIGRKTLFIAKRHPDKFKVVGLSAYKNIDLLKRQVDEFRPEAVCVGEPSRAEEIGGRGLKIFYGNQGLADLVHYLRPDIVVVGITGAVAIYPIMAALKDADRLALANKEAVVIAGELIMKEAKTKGKEIIPVDSEHSAIFQCLKGEKKDAVSRIILTASGGPLFHKSPKQIDKQFVLKHPSWEMGDKITVDSATLMNKGFERFEVYYFFGIPYDKIEIVIHPQSIVHSLVEFCDGATLALLSSPEMELPIQYALSYPERFPTTLKRLNLAEIGKFEFYEVELDKFPCLKLAIEVSKAGESFPCVLNASNEVAVGYFLDGVLKFDKIYEVVRRVLDKHVPRSIDSVGTLMEVDNWAREESKRVIKWL